MGDGGDHWTWALTYDQMQNAEGEQRRIHRRGLLRKRLHDGNSQVHEEELVGMSRLLQEHMPYSSELGEVCPAVPEVEPNLELEAVRQQMAKEPPELPKD